jgi:hypothetical protein
VILSHHPARATKRSIAVVLIHHDRKMGADDPFDTVSGTHGLTGAADTILILKRTANGIVLYARGRDIEEAELAMQFDKRSCKWTILGQAAEMHRSDERSRVIEALKKAGGPLSAKDIMIQADLASRNASDLLLGKLAVNGDRAGWSRTIRSPYKSTDRLDRSERTDRSHRSDRSCFRRAICPRICPSTPLRQIRKTPTH